MAILQSTSITGSLEVTGSLNVVGDIIGNSTISGSLGVTGSVELFDKSLRIGTNIGNSPSPGFNSTWEFRTGPSTYDTELVFRPNGNAGGYNENYWGSIRWSTFGTRGLHLLAGNYTNDIYLGTAVPGSTTVRRWARLSSTGFRIGSSASNTSLAAAEARLHVDGATKLNGNTIITGSNSLAGSYALKVTNTSGADILNVENNNEITLGTTPYTPNDSGQVSNSNVYARGGVYVANTGNNFGMSYEGNRIKYNNGLSRPTFTGTTNGFQSSGELIGTTVRGSNGLQVGGGLGKEVSVVGGDDLDITFNAYGGASLTSGQSWIRLNGPDRTSRNGLLELHAGTNPTNANITLSTNTSERMRITHSGSVGIGLTNPQTNLHVSGAISASTYYGDGSNLIGINTGSWNGIFTGSAQITGSLLVNSNQIDFTSLPTSNPNVAGRLFQTSSEAIGAAAGFQVVCISQG